MRRLASVLLLGVLATTVVPGGAGAKTVVRTSPPLRRSPFVVVAVVDTGINPYHVDFRRPELTVHPSQYIERFPKSAQALDISFGRGKTSSLVARDKAIWDQAKAGRLYWFPGTNIIGAFQHESRASQNTPLLDFNGHGTGVASLAGGSQHGPGSPQILIVSVQGFDYGLQWAAQQPWIDLVTNSWSVLGPVLDQTAEGSYAAVAAGKVVCFASGNLSAPLWAIEGQGPSWHVNVGAASAATRGEHYYTGYPNDVLGLAGVPAASHESSHGERPFGGTSGATPAVCGLIAKTLAEVRARAHDFSEGPEKKALVRGSGSGGYMKDGVLTRREVEDAIQSTATPAVAEFDPTKDPAGIPAVPPVAFLRGGYGIVDNNSAQRAVDVIVGEKRRPNRELEDAWIELTDSVRDAVWGPPPD